MSEDPYTQTALRSLKELADLSAQAREYLASRRGQSVHYGSKFESSDFYSLARCVSVLVDALLERPINDLQAMERIRFSHGTLARRLEDLSYANGDLNSDGFLNNVWLERNRNNLYSCFCAASRLVNRPSGRFARGYAPRS